MEPEVIEVGALTIRFLVTGDDSAGAIAMFETIVPAGARVPAPHSHDAYEETIYGLEGAMTWTVDGDRRTLAAGEALCIRRGAVHGFANDSDATARQLAVVSPAAIGPEYFRDVAGVLAAGRPPDPARIAEVMRRHGLTPA